MPLTPIAETYVACVGLQVSLGGITTMSVMDGGFTDEYSVDEMTNNQGGGAYEDVKTIRKASGTLKVACKGATPTGLAPGSIYALLINAPGGTPGNPAFQGNIRLTKCDVPMMDVHAGVSFSFSWTSQGPYTTTI